MDKTYIEAVRRKLKKQGKTEHAVETYIKKLIDPNYMEEEKVETPEEVVLEVIPVAPEEVVPETEKPKEEAV